MLNVALIARVRRQGGFDRTGLSLAPSYWIDGTNGNDANDGLSLGTAWASVSKIGDVPMPTGATVTVRIVSDTYGTASDYVIRNDASAGGTIGAGSTLNIVCEAGTVIDGTNMAGSENGFEFDSTAACTINIFGNDLVTQNFVDAVSNTPNAYGNRGNVWLNTYDCFAVDCEDGFSAHGTSTMRTYGGGASGCTKAIVHVDTADVEHHEGAFTISGVGNGYGSGTPSIKYFNCSFTPVNTSSDGLEISYSEFYNCQIGTLTKSSRLFCGGTAGVLRSSFINVYADGNAAYDIQLCYGMFSNRVRSGGKIGTMKRSVISGPATGQTSVLFQNYDFGASQQIIWHDNIFETATAAAFMSLDAANAGYLVAASSEFFNNILSGSAAVDADLTAADTGGTVVVDNVSDDALIGAANTLDPDDYGYGDGSPAIGAGVSGGNCGFAIGEVVAPSL